MIIIPFYTEGGTADSVITLSATGFALDAFLFSCSPHARVDFLPQFRHIQLMCGGVGVQRHRCEC